MRQFLGKCLPAAAALIGLLGLAGECRAQAIWGGEVQNAFRPGVYIPYNGAGFSTRYSYPSQTSLFFNQDPNRLYYLDYLDRLDRAERFGYRPPLPPKGYCRPPTRWQISIGPWYYR